MEYRIIKVDSETCDEYNYGTYTDFADVLRVTKGYRYNGIFFTRKGSKWFFIVLTTE